MISFFSLASGDSCGVEDFRLGLNHDSQVIIRQLLDNFSIEGGSGKCWIAAENYIICCMAAKIIMNSCGHMILRAAGDQHCTARVTNPMG